MWVVRIEKKAEKQLDKAPGEIQEAFELWLQRVEQDGPNALRKVNGYWDHALKGEWEGARASSLNQQWRVIYVIQAKEIKVLVLRVSPHDYRR